MYKTVVMLVCSAGHLIGVSIRAEAEREVTRQHATPRCGTDLVVTVESRLGDVVCINSFYCPKLFYFTRLSCFGLVHH